MTKLSSFFSKNSYLLVFIVASIVLVSANQTWKKNPISQDALGYYTYLPAVFVHHDLTFAFYSDDRFKTAYSKERFGYKPEDWFMKCGEGDKKYPKFTIGVALVQTPFFLILDTYKALSSESRIGYERYYNWVPMITTLLITLLGLFFAKKWLIRYYSEYVVNLVLIAISVGTTMLYYSTLVPGYGHNYIFALLAIFLYLFDEFLFTSSTKKARNFALLAPVLLSLSVVIRPTSALFLIFPLSMVFLHGKQEKLLALLKDYRFYVGTLIGLIPLGLQLGFWYYSTGSPIVYSYDDEGFFFSDPEILKGWFSPSNGWFFFGPLTLTFFIGVGIFVKKNLKLALVVSFSYILISYIIFSWHMWFYGFGYGMRALIEFSFIIMLPMAEAFKMIKEKLSKPVLATIFALCIALNMFLIVQWQRQIIVQGMTLKSHAIVFGKLSLTESEKQELQSSLERDYSKSKRPQ